MGPKPFRFNNDSLSHKSLRELVSNCWYTVKIQDMKAFFFPLKKLKALKVVLKYQNKEVFSDIDFLIVSLRDEVNRFNYLADSGVLVRMDIETRYKEFSDLWSLLKIKDTQLFQQSRSRWLKEGNSKSGFFHASVKIKSRRNAILALQVGDVG
ncbi:unnamed protein product [Lathyrus sativus]|nr:unnamed protein product [Lathyrus sativus]